MTDPLSLVALGAAVGGAAGKFVEKAWDSGEKWINSYFENHHEKAQEQAKKNTLCFLTDLAQRVKILENDKTLSPEHISSSQDDPDFSLILKDALLISSRTENKETHKIMARIVSERLMCESDELLSLIIPLSCNALKALTSNQLRFLATATIIERFLPRRFSVSQNIDIPTLSIEWLKEKLPLILPPIQLTHIDLLHMESISCVHLTRLMLCGTELDKLLAEKLKTKDKDSINQFKTFINDTDLGKQLKSHWDKKLSHIMLTSLGLVIGICVYDELTGEQTDLQSYIQQ
jgi:hypothetical protein